jgi:hypothetical protein
MRLMLVLATAALSAALFLPATASAGHGLKYTATLDHPAPAVAQPFPGLPLANAGGPGAQWEYIASFFTGDPHTDLDFFTQRGETYMSAGTLGIGANGAGQTIFQLTQGGQVAPRYVSNQPSAECSSEPSQALGLQHDVEATPKGLVLSTLDQPRAARSDTQLLVDATDNPGHCHDQGGAGGITAAPQGGLELIDVTNINDPVEIGLTSHAGESHTVNVDPKRPHIAYSVTSDAVSLDQPGNRRRNEIPGSSDRLDLDGFEVVDMSSCMNFPAGTTVPEKRDRCRPEVYRFRYPDAKIALGHTEKSAIYGCHELEIYPDDRLTCGSGGAAITFDMRGAFDNNGTPNNFADDKVRGRGGAMPCRVRDSSSAPPFFTGAKVTDCVDGTGEGTSDLDIPSWLAAGKPGELLGVRYIGSVHHMGRGAGGPITTYDSTQDIDFDHELEYSASRRLLIATDERGGGVTPPGATCPTSPADNPQGNGGVHFYRTDRLFTNGPPATAQEAWASYARKPNGDKAIYRATVRTQPQASTCTAHVFQQIPFQNRIFMGWYSQGTQVIDFVENRNGTVEPREAGWFIPANANEWVSQVFRAQPNRNGTFTYWGAAADFALGAGRNAVEIWKVTLPAPPSPRGGGGGGGDG